MYWNFPEYFPRILIAFTILEEVWKARMHQITKLFVFLILPFLHF